MGETGKAKKKGAAAPTATPRAQHGVRRQDGAGELGAQVPEWLPLPVADCEGYEVHRELLQVRSWNVRGRAGARRAEPTLLALARDSAVTLRVGGVSIQFPVWALQLAARGDAAALDKVTRLSRREGRARAPVAPQDVAAPPIVHVAEAEVLEADEADEAAGAPAGSLLGRDLSGAAGLDVLDELVVAFRELDVRVERLASRLGRVPEQVGLEVERAVAPMVARVEALASVPGAPVAVAPAGPALKSSTPREMQVYQLRAVVEGVGVAGAASLLRVEDRVVRAMMEGRLSELEMPTARRLDVVYVCWRDDRLAGVDSAYEAVQGRLSAMKAAGRRAEAETRAWAIGEVP